jgi:hypothetical protein
VGIFIDATLECALLPSSKTILAPTQHRSANFSVQAEREEAAEQMVG